MEREDILILVEKIKKEDRAALEMLGNTFRDPIQRTVVSLISSREDLDKVADALTATMAAFKSLVCNFSGSTVEDLKALLEANLQTEARSTLDRVCEYKRNYTPQELIFLAKTDSVARMMVSYSGEINAVSSGECGKGSGRFKGWFAEGLGSLKGVVKTLAGGPSVASAYSGQDIAAYGAMVIHLRPILNGGNLTSENKL